MKPTELIRSMLIAIGEDPDREGLRDTPNRVVKSWEELFSGYRVDLEEIFSAMFEDGACDEMVILKDIDFSSTCEHHLLPFLGKAHVGYIPNGKVIGVSKLARIVDVFAKRLQIQEKMTQQISYSINQHLKPLGVAVVIEAHHQCMSCRGVNKPNAVLMTSSMLGEFREDPIVRQEFLSLIR